MGYERYLSPNSDYSDFEIHRAQMRHYDDYMARVEDAGITGTFSTGFTYSGDSTGSSGGHISVAGPHTGSRMVKGGPLSGDNVEWVDLEPVLEPENTEIGVGFKWSPHPAFSDVETGAEQRYGDFGAIPFAVVNFVFDAIHNLNNLDQWNKDRLERVRPGIEFNIQQGLSDARDSSVYDPFTPTFFTPGYRTGGGF